MNVLGRKPSKFFVACIVAAWAGGTQAVEPALEYQAREHRNEGIRAENVSGFDIELISARADYPVAPEPLGEQIRLRFFLLDKPRNVDVVVREREPNHFYVLDRVRPPSPWQAGFNVFEWPTADVIRKLGDLRVHHLAVVARVEGSAPRAIETVAPVTVYQAAPPPASVPGYVFTLRLREPAKLTATIYRDPELKVVVRHDLGEKRSGPFDVVWAASGAPEGPYRLVVSGYSLSTNARIDQIVRFYHRPVVR